MTVLIAQMLWCAIGIAVAGFFYFGGRTDASGVFAVASLIYAMLAVAAFRGKCWAWWLTLVPPVAIVVCTGPWAIYNFYAFFTDHPRYLDSPATIFVVAISCGVLLFPALVILVLQVVLRKKRFR